MPGSAIGPRLTGQKRQNRLLRLRKKTPNKPHATTAMTLIAGIKCADGFLVAADTAVSYTDAVYHGDKLHHYCGTKDRPYKVVVACAGYLTTALMASQAIRDEAAALTEKPTLSSLKRLVKKVVLETYTASVCPYWNTNKADESPDFTLIVGIEVESEFDLLVTEGLSVQEVNSYVFHGSGKSAAEYLGESFLRTPGSGSLGFSTATAVQLTNEIYRLAKLHAPSVGLDTQIVAYRTDQSYSPFFSPLTEPYIWAIQGNLKTAIQTAFEKSPLSDQLEPTGEYIKKLLLSMRDAARKQISGEARFVRYRMSPSDNTYAMEHLSHNARIT